MANAPASAANSETTLTLTRLFNAPPEAVFDAWLDPAGMAQWMGPAGVTAEVTTLEAKVGRAYRVQMHTPDGANPAVGGVYKEIMRPTRLVFTWVWEYNNQETLVTLTFVPKGDKTEMTLLHEGLATTEARDNHNTGWTGSLERLQERLES